MFHTDQKGKNFINAEEYRDKVLGCWTGKNIGGTLGGPFEFTHEMLDLSYYSTKPSGNPLPNDDLDLQLVWLNAIEDRGLYHVDERVLGEYWLAFVSAPWNEYGTGCFNMRCGILPPLSGYTGNEKWGSSNGAWIRSEIWACLFPGEPDEAMHFAWCDACVDHSGEGIYAELFTTALESAAFIEHDMNKLLDAGLVRIPDDCRVARSVNLVREQFRCDIPWRDVRNAVLEDNKDLGWFQAPANIAFLVIGLLYGRGDFGQTVCIAANCGDDTDCTAATAGSIMGILLGRSGLPEKWTDPIGDTIVTTAVSTLNLRIPKTLTELTERVVQCKKSLDCENPSVVRMTAGNTLIGPELFAMLTDGTETKKRIASRKSTEVIYDAGFVSVAVDYGEDGANISPGEERRMKLTAMAYHYDGKIVTLKWRLPEGWNMKPSAEQIFKTRAHKFSSCEIVLTSGLMNSALVHLQLEVWISDRLYPVCFHVPFICSGSASSDLDVTYVQSYWDSMNRYKARLTKE